MIKTDVIKKIRYTSEQQFLLLYVQSSRLSPNHSEGKQSVFHFGRFDRREFCFSPSINDGDDSLISSVRKLFNSLSLIGSSIFQCLADVCTIRTQSHMVCCFVHACVCVLVSDWQTQTLAATVTLSIVTPSVTRALNSHCTNALFQFWSCCPAGVNGVISSEGAAACRDEKKERKKRKGRWMCPYFPPLSAKWSLCCHNWPRGEGGGQQAQRCCARRSAESVCKRTRSHSKRTPKALLALTGPLEIL